MPCGCVTSFDSIMFSLLKILNYLSLQLGGDSEAQETLDTIRVAASKSSPMVETANLVGAHRRRALGREGFL